MGEGGAERTEGTVATEGGDEGDGWEEADGKPGELIEKQAAIDRVGPGFHVAGVEEGGGNGRAVGVRWDVFIG